MQNKKDSDETVAEDVVRDLMYCLTCSLPIDERRRVWNRLDLAMSDALEINQNVEKFIQTDSTLITAKVQVGYEKALPNFSTRIHQTPIIERFLRELVYESKKMCVPDKYRLPWDDRFEAILEQYGPISYIFSWPVPPYLASSYFSAEVLFMMYKKNK